MNQPASEWQEASSEPRRTLAAQSIDRLRRNGNRQNFGMTC
jgi:hypothetical protein